MIFFITENCNVIQFVKQEGAPAYRNELECRLAESGWHTWAIALGWAAPQPPTRCRVGRRCRCPAAVSWGQHCVRHHLGLTSPSRSRWRQRHVTVEWGPPSLRHVGIDPPTPFMPSFRQTFPVRRHLCADLPKWWRWAEIRLGCARREENN